MCYVSAGLHNRNDGGVLAQCALGDYREQRENGDKRDEPKEVFPAAGFDGLDIESSDWQGSSKWPDKEGRYWWKLKCKDGREINDYYWKKDEVRGYPDKADSDRYWFSVHHAPSGTKIEGFSARPDREKGYPDKDRKYWSYIQYDECGPIKAWMEQKDKNYVARLQREKQPPQPNAAALRAAEEKQRQEQLAADRLRLAEMKALEDRKIREESEKRAAETKRLEEARLAAENAQRLAAAEKKALEQERLRVEQERHQLEEQRRKLEEEQAKKLSNPESSSSSSRPGPSIDYSFAIRYEDIQVVQVLGEGAFGVVSYGKWHFEDVAVKTLHLQKFSENALLEFKEEAAIMAQLRSDYIVLLKGVSLQPYALVMEYMPGGSLFNLLHSPSALPMVIRHRIALDVAKGLAFLHQHPPHGILHRDLKSQNVLLTEYLRAKLADFGLSKVRVESSRSQAYAQSSNKSVGTIPWMAPECFGIRPKYSEKSDMYAYGMVLWELISRKMPYEDVTDANEIREAVKTGEREEIPEQTTNPREEVPVSFKKVIRFCWFQEVDKRPAAKDAIEALGDIAISMPSPSSGSSSSSSGSSGGLPSGFISNFSSFKH
jgi:serine/threonine protein kinase